MALIMKEMKEMKDSTAKTTAVRKHPAAASSKSPSYPRKGFFACMAAENVPIVMAPC